MHMLIKSTTISSHENDYDYIRTVFNAIDGCVITILRSYGLFLINVTLHIFRVQGMVTETTLTSRVIPLVLMSKPLKTNKTKGQVLR